MTRVQIAIASGDAQAADIDRRHHGRCDDLQDASRVRRCAGTINGIAGGVQDRRAIEVERVDRKIGGVFTDPDRIAKHQGGGAGTGHIGRGAAVVQRQRRRAMRGIDGDRLAHVEGQRNLGAHIQGSGAIGDLGARCDNAGHGRGHGVDLQRSGQGPCPRKVRCISSQIGECASVGCDTGGRQRVDVIRTLNNVAECQRVGSRAALIGRRLAIIEI